MQPSSAHPSPACTSCTSDFSRRAVAYLKGCAVVAVLGNHYLKHYVSTAFAGYANGIIAVFFVVSGFCLGASLERRFAAGGSGAQTVLRYFGGRFIRIFPLYYLSLCIGIVFFDSHYGTPALIGMARGHYWFIASILQCYLVSPLVYAFLKKASTARFLYTLTGLLICANLAFALAVALDIPGAKQLIFSSFVYKRFLLGHVFLFALGMAIPRFTSRISHTPLLRSAPVTAAAFLVTVTLVRTNYAPWTNLCFCILFFATAILITTSLLSSPPRALPFARTMCLAGTYSFSIYLFHPAFYQTLVALGLLTRRSVAGTYITIALLPLFVIACILIERGYTALVLRAGQLVASEG